MKKYKDGTFIAISDFHSYEWPLEKVEKYYLNEYDKIYILGDVTDRGTLNNGSGGIELLRRIKKLSELYPGRVIYVPGNHDDFLYQYAKYNDYAAKRNMEYNHGSQTIKDIDNLRETNKEEFDELIDWLGNLPLQREHYFEGKRHVLAHALFDEELFKENKNFSLKDYRNSGGYNGKYRNVLWFRKGNDSYNPERLPRKNTTMIIGHTPLCHRKGDDLNLENQYEETIEVKCVDGGIAYDGTMLIFTVTHNHKGTNQTFKDSHVDRSEGTPEDTKEQVENRINNIIIKYIKESDTIEEAVNYFLYLTYINPINYNVVQAIENVTQNEVRRFMEEIYFSYIPNKSELTEKDVDMKEILKKHFIKVVLDYITKCQFEKFGKKSIVKGNMTGLISTGDFIYITNSVGNARDLAQKIGINNFIEWLNESDYKSFDDYINTVLGNQYGI